MTRIVVAIAVVGVLFALAPSAHAARAHPTDPVATPQVVYPYVDGGRPDASRITFAHVPHPTLSVYDPSDQLVFRRAIRRTAYWNPRIDGDVLGTDLTDDAGRVFRVCVNSRGAERIGNRYCTKVRVVHVQEDTEIAHKRLGRVYYRKIADPGCSVRRTDLAVAIDCDAGATAVLRYEMDRPSLTSEQSFLGPATFAWKGRYYRWGEGIGLERTVRGADVIASGGFSGKLSWVKKIWSVRTEY
jgi:hypothetical protein